jgi:YgiT-type zinc finger domain-containing protein
MTLDELQDAIRAGQTRVSAAAVREAAADGLLIGEIWDAILSASAEVIEDYSADPHGPSLVIRAEAGGLPEHARVGYPSAHLIERTGAPAVASLISCYRSGGPTYPIRWADAYAWRMRYARRATRAATGGKRVPEMEPARSRCPSCGRGELSARTVEETVAVGGDEALLTLAAEICDYCGERWFGPDATASIDEVIERLWLGVPPT